MNAYNKLILKKRTFDVEAGEWNQAVTNRRLRIIIPEEVKIGTKTNWPFNK